MKSEHGVKPVVCELLAHWLGQVSPCEVNHPRENFIPNTDNTSLFGWEITGGGGRSGWGGNPAGDKSEFQRHCHSNGAALTWNLNTRVSSSSVLGHLETTTQWKPAVRKMFAFIKYLWLCF